LDPVRQVGHNEMHFLPNQDDRRHGCVSVGQDALSDLLPHFSINGELSWQAQNFSDLMFPSASFNGAIGPGFRWDILNYGRILNNVRVQDARFEELIGALIKNKKEHDSTFQEIEEGKRVVVGVNEYKVEEDLDISIFKPDPKYARSQKEKLEALKQSRDQGKVKSSLDAVRKAAESEDNLMPHFITAAKAYATLGEICGVLREVFGEYQPVSTVG